MRIKVVLQNLADGGRDSDGVAGDRWAQLMRRLSDEAPDVALLNEALGWGGGDGALLRRAARALGMTPLPLPPSRSGYHVAILYRAERLGEPVDYNTDFSADARHGIAVAAWEVGLPAPLAVTVTHLSPFSPTEALMEAEWARWTALRHGPYAIVGADFNAPPLSGPGADVSRMSVLDRAARFLDPLDDPPRQPDSRIAAAFHTVGFADAGALLHQATGDERHLARTGRSDRIDRILVSAPLRDAVVGGALLDQPAGASNHHGVAAVVDLALASIS